MPCSQNYVFLIYESVFMLSKMLVIKKVNKYFKCTYEDELTTNVLIVNPSPC